MSEPVLIAKGDEWSEGSTIAKLIRLGFKEEQAKNSLYLVESTFANQANLLECQAEWSIRFAEVTGQPEDLQFDIDEIRESSIEEVFEIMDEEPYE